MAEAPDKKCSEHLMIVSNFMELKPEFLKGFHVHQKLSGKAVTLSSETIIGTVSEANIIPPTLAPKPQ